jgi:ribonuclease P protein subunit RPR2
LTHALNKKRQLVKQIAREYIDGLVENALREKDDRLAAKQAQQAKRIAMHQRICLPYEIRQLYCKRCKSFIIPGRSSRVRIGRAKTRAVRITCLKCGHTYHKILICNKDL